MHTLVLDQGYVPHRVVSWERAVSMLYVGKADVLEEYDEVIRSVSLAMRMPAVVRLRRGTRRFRNDIKFSRLNVMRRDGFRCLYCGRRLPMSQLTYDHVVPRSHGGATEWANIVTACRPCNERKGSRTPEQAGMPLLKRPVRPTWLPHSFRMGDGVPSCWKDWVTWADDAN